MPPRTLPHAPAKRLESMKAVIPPSPGAFALAPGDGGITRANTSPSSSIALDNEEFRRSVVLDDYEAEAAAPVVLEGALASVTCRQKHSGCTCA